ncbi:hypothetical protein ZWY2020_002320 [Hordeum vulgare]|nr:hypothetical protein ZWY2020_002320 [Hordeum vulgare]
MQSMGCKRIYSYQVACLRKPEGFLQISRFTAATNSTDCTDRSSYFSRVLAGNKDLLPEVLTEESAPPACYYRMNYFLGMMGLYAPWFQGVRILALKVNFRVFSEVKILASFLRCFPNISTLHIESGLHARPSIAYQPTWEHHAKFWPSGRRSVLRTSEIIYNHVAPKSKYSGPAL